MGYTKETIKGVSWLGAFRLFTRALSFFRTIIIAHILSPNQFGLYGIAAITLAFLEMVSETGINIYLVQKIEKIDKYLDTAWIVSIIRGFAISIIILASTPFVSFFFNSPQVTSMLILLSLVPILRGFINPSVVRFQKEFKFNKEFYYRTSIFLVETAVSLLLVIVLRDPISLIWGIVAGAVFELAISFLFIRPNPRVSYNFAIFKDIIFHGKWITFGGIFTYLFHNADNVVVGKLLGTGSLGVYDMVYRISMLPITEVADIVSRVTFPVYVRIEKDRLRLKKAYIKTTILVGLVSLPFVSLFFFFSEPIIQVILGPKWLSAVDILRVLSLFALIHVIITPSNVLLYSVKKQNYVSLLSFVSFVTMVLLIIPLVRYLGIVGAGIAAILGLASSIPFLLFFLLKVFKKNSI